MDTPDLKRYETREWYGSIHPADRPVVQAAVERLVRSQGAEPYEVIYRFNTADGWRWLMSRGRAASFLPDGNLEWIAGVCLDIQKTMSATLTLDRDERWLDAFDRLTQGYRFITSYSADGEQARVEFVSPTVESFFGVPVDRLLEDVNALRSRILPQDLKALKATIAQAIGARASTCELRYRLRLDPPRATVRHIRSMATIEYTPDGAATWYGMAIDVTEEALLHEQLQHRVQQLQSTLSLLPDLWFELDGQGNYLSVHANDPDLLARPAEQLLGHNLREVLPADVADRMARAMFVAKTTAGAQKIRYALQLADGLHHFEAGISVPTQDSGRDTYTVLVRDLTETVQIYEAREQALLHDSLTGLWNRAGLRDAALQPWGPNRRAPHEPLLMLLMDIDGLRDINHTLGHEAGDRLLWTLARRLTGLCPGAVAARLGGDEFLAVMPQAQAADDAWAAAWVLDAWRTLSAPLTLMDGVYRPSVSVGWHTLVCAGDWDAQRLQEAIVHVEESLYAAKRSGHGRIERFDPDRFAAGRRRHDLVSALGTALVGGELWLAMQPIVWTNAEHAIGAEALVRWKSHKYGEVSPAQFIPLAERSHAILGIGAWILEQACRWAVAHPDVAQVSVNISPKQFSQPDFADGVVRTLSASGLAPGRLCLEITESLLADDLADVAAKMRQLSQLGVRFALDDFGTGYSNLLQLKTLPLHELKLDRSYINDVLTDPDDACIVGAVIALAHQLDMVVVAEGVETIEQSQWLQERRCDAQQGYLFSKPVPAHQWPQYGTPVRGRPQSSGLD